MACGRSCAAPAAGLARRAADGAGPEGLVVVLGRGQQQLGQLLVAQHVEDESRQHQRGNHGRDIENAAKALPSLALRVEKYLVVGHILSSISRAKTARRSTLYSTNRMEATHQSQLTAPPPPRPVAAPACAPRSLSLRALAAGLAPAPLDAQKLFQVNGDSLIYGAMAKNLLLHGRYGLTVANGAIGSHPHPPARLPALPRPLLPPLRHGELLLPPSSSKSPSNSSAACCSLDFAARIAPPHLAARRAPCHPLARRPLSLHRLLCRRSPH